MKIPEGGKLFLFEYFCRFSNVTQIIETPSIGAIYDLLCRKLLHFLYSLQQKKHFMISDLHAEKTNLNGFPTDQFSIFYAQKKNYQIHLFNEVINNFVIFIAFFIINLEK